LWLVSLLAWADSAPLGVPTNLTFTVMAANLTGGSQRYEAPQIRLFQGLQPDIIAIQEFRYGNSSPSEIRSFVDTAFGTNFVYYRESSPTETYSIPNGIVSRFPIVEAGAWDDLEIPDRGFAWARIRLLGTNELYLVSVHLKSGSNGTDKTRRANEATQLKSLVQSSFPSNAWIIVAGDFNAGSRTETAQATFTSFLSDSPIPTDAPVGGNDNTNLKRTSPYDYVLPSFSLTNRLQPVRLGNQCFSNGLVFDSRLFTPLTAVAPIQMEDATNCQHLAVLKAFEVAGTTTNWVEVLPPALTIDAHWILRWSARSNLVFRVLASPRVTDQNAWSVAGEATSPTSNYFFNLGRQTASQNLYRVICP
jgi:endonuclease/exonuclease/phosphatase family metal-dependent hydrolase